MLSYVMESFGISSLKAWFNRGRILSEQGFYGGAIESYNRAIDIDPQDADAWINKSNALQALGSNADADAALTKAKELGYLGDQGYVDS